MSVAYVLGVYPSLTTTFIDREILDLMRRGLDLVLLSIRGPEPFEMSDAVRELADSTHYLWTARLLKLLVAHLRFAWNQPRSYWGTLAYLLTRRHPNLAEWLKTLFYFAIGILAAEVLREKTVDHIHAHFASRTTVIAMVASRLLGVPYSFTAHAYDIYVSPVMLAEKIAGAKFVATCTGYNKTHLERISADQLADKVQLVYHGIELAKFDGVQRSEAGSEPPLLLSVGQLKEKKGFPYLIEACRLLKDQGCDFRCEIVGEGPQREALERLIDQKGLGDRVRLCGALPHSEVIAKYARASLFALASVLAEDGDRDGIPNVLLEAMAMQVPVVSTQFSGIPEAVDHGVTGLLVPCGDAAALADALARLLLDPALRSRFGQAGHQYVLEKFDIRRNTDRLAQLFTA